MTKKIDLQIYTPDKIRNFSIVAHIDHGKSTLSDRLLEATETLSGHKKHAEQFLDKLQVERERGITVKAQTVSMFYHQNNEEYLLNLIDTPGHVDFSYEVSRSLYACQGAILLVDAVDGIQAQTMANFYLAFEQGLKIIPVINKIDLQNAQPEKIAQELQMLFDFNAEDILFVSAKTGEGIPQLLEAIVKRLPAPAAHLDQPLKALLFDSWFDEYRGVVCLVYLQSGSLKKGDQIELAQMEKNYEILEVGLMHPNETPQPTLYAGQVGYIIAGMKTVRDARVGDTIFNPKEPIQPFPGFKPAKPMVFAGIYPIDSSDFNDLQEAIEKLTLNDASVSVEKKTSTALGIGFRCGFLGLLHMDVFKQRLEQEYDQVVIVTAPSVLYKLKLKSGETVDIENPSEFPDPTVIEEILEPIMDATIIVPQKFIGNIISLCEEKLGKQKEMTFLDTERIILKYELPLNEIATDFYDQLKSLSSGYASFDYEGPFYRPADLVKLDILLNGQQVDALSIIVHKEKAYYVGRNLTEKLRKVIPRQMYDVAIQAAIGAKIIARETVKAFRKDVTGYLYGGDITRKMKLLEKQKKGKKRMKQIGKVTVPQEAFYTILKKD
ncbi:TPA: elongation factor 4 [Candidatus Dependentiae bacterium]|nr:MAG: Membrane GTPase LepA [candidate division TM6 bacterium GW2011_GWF2_36_131]KKQ02600.1 MAG: Membrane GTPase LepA [candidate division TM6 bacterium GW2011_GWE2_36_25]KKQ19095.1 MAG: Membrane GTPase LepA [candidate division TM6 bacterium GW2011_GWA2_36_9]HBR70185.1 elongation factor 4 [Candidatus Dependentiae bacterium]HCU00083.1 elongation factor 4 [Candidatus Dependentiae bacterium]